VKIIRFDYKGQANYGVLEESGKIKKIKGTIDEIPLNICSSPVLNSDEITLLAPCEPTKIIGIGLNFIDHIESVGLNIPEEPYIFIRPSSSLNAHNGTVIINNPDHYVQYEGELAVVMGKKCSKIDPKEARKHILGYTCANDVTDKTLFLKDGHFGRGKAFDTHCPVGPLIETELDISSVSITTTVNGEIRQNGTVKNMVFSVEFLVSFLSEIMTLYPGDLIITGSPAGVGPLVGGDVVEVAIPGIGTLFNQVLYSNEV